jgi:hypothetical protein
LIVDAHRDGKRFVVRADEKLTAFVAVEAATWGVLKSLGSDHPHVSLGRWGTYSGLGFD